MSNLRLAFILEVVDRATAVVSRVDRAVDRMTGPVRRVHAQWQAMARDPQVQNAMGRLLQTAQPIIAWGRAAAGALTTVAAAASGVVFALNGVVSRVSSVADQAIKLGMTTEQFTQLGFAAKQAGAGQEVLGNSLVILYDKLTEARSGGKEAITWLSRVGVTMADLKNGIGVAGVLDRMADTFSKVADTSQNAGNKVAVTRFLMGRSGADLIQLLNGGSAGLREMANESDRVGATLNGTAAAAMKAYGDKTQTLSDSLFGLATRIVTAALPAMSKVVDRLLSMSVASQDAWADRLGQSLGRLVEILPGLLGMLADFGGWLVRAVVWVDDLVKGTVGWNTVLAVLVGIVGGKALLAVYGLAQAVFFLATALWATPVGMVVLGITGLIGLGALLIAKWEPVKAFFEGLWAPISRVLGAFNSKMTGGVAAGAPSIYAGADDWARYRAQPGANAASAVAAGAPVPSAMSPAAAGGKAEVGGTLKVVVDDQRTRVTNVRKAPGGVMDIEAYDGRVMPAS